MLVLLLAGDHCRAQYSPSFDSMVRSALSVPDPGVRLTKLRSLVNPSYSVSVFQTISYGNAFLQVASEVRSDTDIYQAHMVLCTGYERNRDFERSVSNGLEAVRNAARRKDYLRQVRAFQDVAFTYSSMGLMSGNKADMDKAFYYCDQAMQVGKDRNVTSEMPYILKMTGDVFAMNKMYDTAISLYNRAIATQKSLGLGVKNMGMYMNLGIALNLNKDYDAALAAYAMADSICDQQKDGDFLKAKIASNRAILYGDMGRMQESERLANTVLASAQRSGATDIQVDMVDHLKNLFRKQGRYREALDLSDTLAAIKERMLTAEKTGQVAEMEARYDAGVKDEQIAGQQYTIRQNKRQTMYLWSGIGLLFSVGSVAFAGWRRSTQLNGKINVQQQQLMTQKTELQRINEMKDHLFGLIGHDVRVPLNSMMAYATLLDQQGDLPPDKIKKYNTDLRQALGYTTVLMENLLQFAKSQMQATQPYPEFITLSVVMDRVLRLLGPAMEQKNMVLQKEYDDDTTTFADEDMTEVILRNLLSNAIKFSNTGGHIVITIKPCDDYICCTIQDNGTGMTPELISLWNDNTSAHVPARSRIGTHNEKGAGLGSMLSKTFAALMSGRLLVESAQGKGSSCSLLLPGKSPAA